MLTCLSEARARAAVYMLLARLWADEPGPVLQELAQPRLAEAWIALGGTIPEDAAQASLDEVYCRLFIGPSGHLTPLQSVWQHGELQSDVTASIRRYQSVVPTDGPWRSATLPDHLGTELWMMGRILNSADEDGSETQASNAVAAEVACHFFADHLAWAEVLLRAVVHRDRTGFYGTVADVTLRFLQDESDRFAVPLTS